MKAFILFFILSMNYVSRAHSQEMLKTVCVKDVCVQAEIVDTDAARQRGLMFRENLPEGQGMLFVFETEGRYGFWMKNMRFPIDIIWIDKEKRVVDIKPNLSPCQEVCESFAGGDREKSCEIFEPRAKALYALEVHAGFSRRNKIEIGDKVSIDGH
ncbi:MAG: DUF192 domain-containing protein [Candidatus Omnitrophota bacterium]|nr:DUF192 domain-containing protein [Candidatus Omnitrophota bacterium]